MIVDRILNYLVFLSGYPHVKNSCSSAVRALVMFTKGRGFESHQGSIFHMGSHFWLIVICVQMTSPNFLLKSSFHNWVMSLLVQSCQINSLGSQYLLIPDSNSKSSTLHYVVWGVTGFCTT